MKMVNKIIVYYKKCSDWRQLKIIIKYVVYQVNSFVLSVVKLTLNVLNVLAILKAVQG